MVLVGECDPLDATGSATPASRRGCTTSVRHMRSYPERLLTDDESVVLLMHPHWRVLLGALGALLGAVAMVVVGYVLRAQGSWVLPVAGGLALLVVVALVVPPVVRRLFTQYVLTTERIVVREGVVARTGTEIPLESVTNVEFSQSVVERMLGYGDVLLESAGRSGQSRLRDVPDPEAFQSQVYGIREQRSLHFSGGGDAPRDVASQLEVLAGLHDRGKLTDEEFAAQKARLLDAD